MEKKEEEGGGGWIALTRWSRICFEVAQSEANRVPRQSEAGAAKPSIPPTLPWAGPRSICGAHAAQGQRGQGASGEPAQLKFPPHPPQW